MPNLPPSGPFTPAHVQEIAAWAHELGLNHCGVAPITPSSHAPELLRWLAAGYQADMAWLERNTEVRLDPRSRFPWARSVVVVGLNYLHPLPEGTSPEALVHRVARYARGRDYHRILPKLLQRLGERIRQQLCAEVEFRAYSDTGPLLERDYFALSGLGWIGKHSLGITQGEGSWFLLGVLLTNLELPAPLTLHPDRCGSCTRCLDACPTGAIVEPYRVDSRRCISYHTIESRQALPPEVRERLGGWGFGCDICQEVCPWNREAPHGTHPDLAPQPRLTELTAEALSAMGEQRFEQTFAGSPLRRAGYAGLLRNLGLPGEVELTPGE